MAKTKRGFIFAAFLVSCGATVLAIVAMATENWISATLQPNLVGIKGDGIVNYGLFFGTFKNNPIGGSTYNTYPITCECVTAENGCAFSAQKNKEDREKEINDILSGKVCSKVTKNFDELYFVPDTSIEIFEENKVMFNRTRRPAKLIDANNRIKRTVANNFVYDQGTEATNSSTLKCDPTFVNMGLYISTLMFLSIAILIGSLITIITLRNVVGNPVNPWFNIWGLYIWNSGAAGVYFFVLMLWGIEYDLYIKNNIGLIETLKGQYSNNEVELGYSYWILIISIFLHGLSCGLFYLRQHLIDKEPEIPDKPDGNADGMIFVY